MPGQESTGASLGGTREVRDGMLVEWDVGVPMDDGIVLRADIYRPPGEGRRYPAILSSGPYAKGMAFQDGYARQWQQLTLEAPEVLTGSSGAYQNWETVDPERWVPDGYACVRVDSRGAGASPGVLDVWSAREARDLHACIEWAAGQPWCNGRVGLCGISYYAMNQWQAAALQPPHLAAMVAWEGASDFYRELFYHGGMRSLFVDRWFPRQVVSVQHGRGGRVPANPRTGRAVAGTVTLSDAELAAARRDIAEDAAAHPLEDGWHRDRRADLTKVTVPLLSSANWGGLGLHSRGNFEGFLGAASRDKWLEVHGGTHFTAFYTDDGHQLQKHFFDCFLKDKDNGWRSEPKVRLQVRHADGHVTERHDDSWPLTRTRWTRFYLDPQAMALSTAPPGEGSVRYRGMGEGVTFVLGPLETELEITGPAAARLWLSSSTTDADVFIVLRVFDPAGAEVVFQGANDPHTPIAQGWLRASHRKLDRARSLPYRPYHPHDEIWPLQPGDACSLDVEIWPTSIVVPPGYRLAVTLLGRDYTYGGDIDATYLAMGYTGCAHFVHTDPADRPPEVFDNQATVYGGGERASYLLLPVIPSGG